MRRVPLSLFATLGATLTLILAAAASQLLQSPGESPRMSLTIEEEQPTRAPSQGIIETKPGRSERAILLVHDEWSLGAQIAGRSYNRACPDGELQEREIAAFSEALSSLGFAVEVRSPGEVTGREPGLALVVHHNGGWGSYLSPREQDLLQALHASGVPLLFAGDDAPSMVNSYPKMRRLLGISRLYDNGHYPIDVEIRGALVRYEKEPDNVLLEPGARVLASAGRTPAAWVAPADGGGPVAVFDLGIRASDVCPVASRGEDLLRGLLIDLAAEITALR